MKVRPATPTWKKRSLPEHNLKRKNKTITMADSRAEPWAAHLRGSEAAAVGLTKDSDRAASIAATAPSAPIRTGPQIDKLDTARNWKRGAL
jgi:hypothetical protein